MHHKKGGPLETFYSLMDIQIIPIIIPPSLPFLEFLKLGKLAAV
jgi:hypothetical protein